MPASIGGLFPTMGGMRIFGFNSHGGPEVLQHLQVPALTPGPGEVLVDVQATSVNPGDLNTREGTNDFEVVFPMAFGREAAGTVVAVGEGVAGIESGQLVFGSSASGHGSFGEQALLDAASVTPVPEGLDVQHAACIPVAYGTALDLIDMLDLQAGQQFVVLGAGGGVGTAVTSLATARGIEVIGVASAGKKELVEALGGRHVESGPGWVDRVRAVAGHPVALFDLVGGDVLREGAELTDRLVSVADKPTVKELGGTDVPRRRTREVFAEVARLLASGRAKVTVSDVRPLSDAAAAVAVVEDGHATGKVVVTVP